MGGKAIALSSKTKRSQKIKNKKSTLSVPVIVSSDCDCKGFQYLFTHHVIT